jgi:hypothetical protein
MREQEQRADERIMRSRSAALSLSVLPGPARAAMTETVYVELRDEGVDVWRPVEAQRETGSVLRLPSVAPEGEQWAFPPGSRVRCERRGFGRELVASGECDGRRVGVQRVPAADSEATRQRDDLLAVRQTGDSEPPRSDRLTAPRAAFAKPRTALIRSAWQARSRSAV